MDQVKLEQIIQQYANVLPISERIAKSVYQAIVSGVFPVNYKITEEALAELFHVSRTPAHEAIRQLTNDGFLINQPRVGNLVREWTIQDFQDLYAVMEVIEGFAARVAAGSKISQATAFRLRSAIEQAYAASSAGSRDISEKFNQEFHMGLAQESGNLHLIEINESLITKARLIRPVLELNSGKGANAADQVYEDHQRILEAVLAGDEQRAEDEARAHIQRSMEYALKAFAGIMGLR